MRTHTVKHPKVNNLGRAALVFGDVVHRYRIDLAGGFCMNINVTVKIIDQLGVVSEHSRQTQFKLTVVGTDKGIAGFRDKCRSNRAAKIGTNGYIL